MTYSTAQSCRVCHWSASEVQLQVLAAALRKLQTLAQALQQRDLVALQELLQSTTPHVLRQLRALKWAPHLLLLVTP